MGGRNETTGEVEPGWGYYEVRERALILLTSGRADMPTCRRSPAAVEQVRAGRE
jgi:hypothetical protein